MGGCVMPNMGPRLRAVITELLSPWVYDGRHQAFVAYYRECDIA
jgi:hypothetical protein